MGRLAWFLVFDNNFLEGWTLVEVDLSVLLSTGRQTEGSIWFESNGARFALEMLRQVTLRISRIPLNDASTNGLSNKDECT